MPATLLLPLAAVVGWLYFLALPAALAAAAANPVATPQMSGVQPGPPPSVTILFTGEVIGWTEPCG